MSQLRLSRRARTERYGERVAAKIDDRSHTLLEQLHAKQLLPASRAQRSQLQGRILPALAMYRALCEELGGRDAALGEMDRLFAAQVEPARRLMGILHFIPDAFDAFRFATLLDVWLRFPPALGKMTTVENSRRCLAIDMRSCYCFETLQALGAPELTAVFCSMDDKIYAGLPPAIRWERTQTLGRGANRCDFRWRRSDLIF